MARASSSSDVFLYFLALFLPPLAVFFKRELHGDFWINVILSIIGWIPGVIHAWYIIAKFERPAPLLVQETRAPIGSAPPPMASTTAPAAGYNGYNGAPAAGYDAAPGYAGAAGGVGGQMPAEAPKY